MYIPDMSEKEKFIYYFEMTNKLYRSMVYGLFLYPLFVAVAESFQWDIFHYLNFETIKNMGVTFIVLSIVFFPLSYMTEPYFVRGCRDVEALGKKLMYASIANMALSETITLFGLIVYITTADLKFFYLFFIFSFIHLISIRPSRKKWQSRLDKISK
ncbi:MAG: hypothetical protein C0602_09715 [Denitrovibrio sp.]|nr:MAG: hypothetical protein C0602_09715 [Denitrovibrio sp.]